MWRKQGHSQQQPLRRAAPSHGVLTPVPRSDSSLVAPLHSINLGEHRNAPRWQVQQVPKRALQPGYPLRRVTAKRLHESRTVWLLVPALLLLAGLWVSSQTTFSLSFQIQNGDNKSIKLKGLSSGPNAKPHILALTWHSKCSITAKHCDNRFLSFLCKARYCLSIIRISSSYLNSRSFRFNFFYPTEYILKVISDPFVIQKWGQLFQSDLHGLSVTFEIIVHFTS